jgi:predicted PhzF superfamily epimerase YddE/YHI9
MSTEASGARFRIFQVDAFTDRRFAGNPAAVMLMDRFPGSDLLTALAAENNLSETAFLVPQGREYRIRWFTPSTEVPLCGHATLASAAVVMEHLEPGRSTVVFQSPSGPLAVHKKGLHYVMDFPGRSSERIPPSQRLLESLGVAPAEVWANEFNYMAVYSDPSQVRDLVPDSAKIAGLDRPGVIVTAPGEGPIDFVSRYFAPAKGVPEDPVTGAAHCMLAPYWARRLGKAELKAYQASRRGGEVVCRVAGDRVELEGACIFYMEGWATV